MIPGQSSSFSFFLSFPEGRLNTKFDRVILAMFAIVALPLEFLWLLFFRTGGSPAERIGGLAEQQCRRRCRLGTARSARDRLCCLGGITAVGGGGSLQVRHFAARSSPRSSARQPSSCPWSCSLSTSSTSSSKQRDPVVLGAHARDPARRSGGHPPARVLRVRAVGELFVELRADPSPPDLRDALARALRRSVAHARYWLPQFRSWADLERRAGGAAGWTARARDDADRPGWCTPGGAAARSGAGR